MADDLPCETCGRTVGRDEAVRSETFGDLDPTKRQTLCCPDYGSRLKTVFVGRE